MVLGVIGTPADHMSTPDEELAADDVEAGLAPHDFDLSDIEPKDPVVEIPERRRASQEGQLPPPANPGENLDDERVDPDRVEREREDAKYDL